MWGGYLGGTFAMPRRKPSEETRRKAAREAVAAILDQLSSCERKAYNGTSADEYQTLLKQIEGIKAEVRLVGDTYLDESLFQDDGGERSRCSSRRSHPHTLSVAPKAVFGRFTSRFTGWRRFLMQVVSELSR